MVIIGEYTKRFIHINICNLKFVKTVCVRIRNIFKSISTLFKNMYFKNIQILKIFYFKNIPYI